MEIIGDCVGMAVRWVDRPDSNFLQNHLIPSFGTDVMVIESFRGSSIPGWEAVTLSRNGELLREVWFSGNGEQPLGWIGEPCWFALDWFEFV